MSTVVVLTGGSPHAHDFSELGSALVELVAAAGHDCRSVDHPDAAVDLLAEAGALVVDGLWWQMAGDAYAPWRNVHAYSPPASTRTALCSFVEGGGGMLALHTSAICFDDWPEWGDVVGGSWRWGHSSHPPYGPVSATIAPDRTTHPVVAGLPPVLHVHDEVYGDLDLRPGIDVLATARRRPDDDHQPVVWAHRYGDGRVVYDGFGHDAASIRQPDHARLLSQALAWVLGDDDA